MGAAAGGARRTIAVLVGAVLVASATMASEPVVAQERGDPPDWVADLVPSSQADDPDAPPVEEPGMPPVAESLGIPARQVSWPEAASSTVTLGGADDPAVAVADDVIRVASATDAVDGARVRVEVLDRAAARNAGVPGFIFQVEGTDDDPVAALGGADPAAVNLSIGYSGFEHAYGAAYGDRLVVRALPACALVMAWAAGCRLDGVEVPTRNDRDRKRLVVEVEDLGALATRGTEAGDAADPSGGSPDSEAADAGQVVFAVMSDPSGEAGSFAATPLSATSDWQVAPGSGDFSWSYPIPVPAPPAGAPPELSLGYSSGSVDGLVSTRNTQSPMTGIGFGEFNSSFIERRYVSCQATLGTPDMCWQSNNASIVFNGRASEMVATNPSGDEWRLKADPGWRVQRLSGASNGDNTGEYWKVTTPDGVQYFFGLGRNPDTAAETNSAWTVPVFADHDTDPCRSDPGHGCNQAWRWNLDRVVDPNGVTSTYFYNKATNHYRAIGGLYDPDAPYTRGGSMQRIEYGKPAGTGTSVAAAGRVVFEQQFRCVDLNASCPSPPEVADEDERARLFPDVPFDMLCASSCVVTAPTFWTASRQSAVRTEVRVGGEWRPVAQYNLAHTFLPNADGHDKLYLRGVQRVGLAQSGLLWLPTVVFLYTGLPNRVDTAGGVSMGHHRLSFVVDEYGHHTEITYGQKDRCASTKTAPWDTNVEDCFPQRHAGRWAVFHKYLATSVSEHDPTGGSPTVTTTYHYEGTPAWHHDDDEFVPLGEQSWSDWRGYGTTRITQGASTKRVRLFRGMHGDHLASGGSRVVQITNFSESRPFYDDPWLAGAVLEEASLGPSNEMLESTLHEYEARVTLGAGPDPLDWVVWVGETVTTTSIARAIGQFEQQRTTTAYASLRPYLPASVHEEGWLNQAGDERCTKTSYANNPTAGMFTYPSSVVTVAGACDSTTELSHTETYYDGSTALGEAPTRGNATRQRVRLEASTWVTTAETTYDSVGRVRQVTDAAGHVTESSYEATPNGGYPTTTTQTSHVGSQTHVTTTEWLPELGAPLRVTDPNGNITSYEYDALGRQTGVRLPTEQGSGAPLSWQFVYIVDQDKLAPPIVRSRQLQSVSPEVYVDSWVVYDTALRQRQAQTLSPQANRTVVAETTYDNMGLVRDETLPQAVEGTPGRLFTGVSWENRTRTTYDPLGRPSRQAWMRGGTEMWATGHSYTHDTTTVEQNPSGRRSRTVVDGLDRTIRAEEWDGTGWQATVYGYDLADNLTSIQDPAGNTITYTYNMVGWRRSMDDPDAGAWLYGYDDMGNQTTVTDARGVTTHTSYDVIGRPTHLRRDGSTGPLLATWSYDAAGEKGLLDSSTRVTSSGNWVTDVNGYDARGRPLGTSLTVPSGVAGLSGSYPVTQSYDRADHVTSVTYPAVGGLAAETVTTRYNSLGLPEHMAGAEEYVWAAGYDNRGRPSSFGFGPRPNGQAWLARSWSYDPDQRLSRMQTALNGSLAVDHELTYDVEGNLEERTTQLGAESWRECFDYDLRDRLVEAFTVGADAACADESAAGTGARPYDHTYSYSPDGNLRQRTEGAATDVYTYPAPGADRPHAPTQVGDDTYRWDANGALQSRTVDGATETLAWDAERRLASVTGSDGTDSYLYEADGARLLRTTPGGRTLFFGGHEITANTSGSTVTAVRSYSFGGSLVATRSPAGVDYLMADQQGSVEASAPSGGALDVSRSYDPYGRRRSGGELDTDQGWIGQVEDDTTGLAYLNSRYYDPNIGTFISTDPRFDPDAPKGLNPYSYAHNNPVEGSDPTGDCMPLGGNGRDGCVDVRWGAEPNIKQIAKFNASKHGRTGSTSADTIRSNWQRSGTYDRINAYARWYRSAARAAALTLSAMHRANPNPNFWRALSAAGSAEGLVLAGLRAANPNPGFWQFISQIQRNCGVVCAFSHAATAARGRAVAEDLRIQARTLALNARADDLAATARPTPDQGHECTGFGAALCHAVSAADAGADWVGDRNWGDLIGGTANVVRGAFTVRQGFALAGLAALGCAPCGPGGYALAGFGVSRIRVGVVELRRGFRECSAYCSTRDQLAHATQEQLPIVGDGLRCRRGGC